MSSDSEKEKPARPAIASLGALVGNTPLVHLRRTGDPDGAPIYVKLEDRNPSGSIRDRYIQEIIERAMLADQLREGDAVSLAGIDDSAVAAAFVASTLGLELRVFAPEGSSRRLVGLIRRWGGEIEWTPDEGGLEEAIRVAADWARPHPDRLYVDGYRRTAVKESYRQMAQEILRSLEGRPLGAFVTSVTTGGTFRAVSEELRNENPTLIVGGITITENQFATADIPGVQEITLGETWQLRDEIARTEGLLLGPKGAACVKLAVELQEQVLPDQAIVALNPDAGQRYLGWEDKTLFKTAASAPE